MFGMLTNKIQSETKLVVDWAAAFGEPEGSYIVEYDTSVIPFKIWRPELGIWRDTKYVAIVEIREMNGSDIIWMA